MSTPYTGSEAYSGAGAVLSVNTSATATPSYVPIQEVISCELSGRTAKVVSCTNLSSGTVDEFLATVIDSGVISAKCNYRPTDPGQQQLSASFATLKKTLFTLTLPLSPVQLVTGDVYSFAALVSDFSFNVDTDKQIMLDVKLKISGALTLVSGS